MKNFKKFFIEFNESTSRENLNEFLGFGSAEAPSSGPMPKRTDFAQGAEGDKAHSDALRAWAGKEKAAAKQQTDAAAKKAEILDTAISGLKATEKVIDTGLQGAAILVPGAGTVIYAGLQAAKAGIDVSQGNTQSATNRLIDAGASVIGAGVAKGVAGIAAKTGLTSALAAKTGVSATAAAKTGVSATANATGAATKLAAKTGLTSATQKVTQAATNLAAKTGLTSATQKVTQAATNLAAKTGVSAAVRGATNLATKAGMRTAVTKAAQRGGKGLVNLATQSAKNMIAGAVTGGRSSGDEDQSMDSSVLHARAREHGKDSSISAGSNVKFGSMVGPQQAGTALSALAESKSNVNKLTSTTKHNKPLTGKDTARAIMHAITRDGDIRKKILEPIFMHLAQKKKKGTLTVTQVQRELYYVVNAAQRKKKITLSKKEKDRVVNDLVRNFRRYASKYSTRQPDITRRKGKTKKSKKSK